MVADPKNIATSVTVTSSRTVERPDGRIAIVLDTKELGSIGFEVDQQAIDASSRNNSSKPLSELNSERGTLPTLAQEGSSGFYVNIFAQTTGTTVSLPTFCVGNVKGG